MLNCKESDLPMEPKLNLTGGGNNEIEKPFRELIGCLMYLNCCSRPDICFSINYFSQFQNRQSNQIWNHLKRILRYLKKTINYCLVYERSGNFNLNCFVDADWASNIEDRKSVSGYVIQLGKNSIMWKTKKQQSVSLSTAEAELVSLSLVVCESIWLKKLLIDFNIETKINVFEDNQACIKIIKNPENITRVKHIDIKLKFLVDNINKNNITINYICSEKQLGDIFTKGLTIKKFIDQVYGIGLRDFKF